MNIAVEDESDDFAVRVDAGTAGVSADDVVVRNEIERRVEGSATVFFGVEPGLREVVRIDAIV